jgi:hypothetical protein
LEGPLASTEGGFGAIACRARSSSSAIANKTIEACWCLAHDHVIVVFVYLLLLVLGGPASAAGGVGLVVDVGMVVVVGRGGGIIRGRAGGCGAHGRGQGRVVVTLIEAPGPFLGILPFFVFTLVGCVCMYVGGGVDCVSGNI